MNKRFVIAITCITYISAYCMTACNSSNKDSKGKADSVNNFYDSLNNKKGGRGDREVSGPDAKFAVEAADGGLAEVELARLALQKSSSADVKAFADMMIKDHSKANEELKTIAKSKRIALPAEMGAEAQKIKTQLEDQPGIAFDKAYIDAMVKDHRKDVKSFQDGKKIVHYEELAAFIDKTLPVLKMHYDAVLKLQGKIK